MIVFLLSCTTVLFVIASWLYLLRDAKRTRLPGPFPYPVIGNGHLFLGDSGHFLKALSDIANEYGDASRFHIMNDRFILLSHPKYIDRILSSTELITKGISYKYMRPWLGDGLLTSTGRKWKSHRRLLTPAFHYNSLQSFLPIFIKNEKILSKQLKSRADGSPVELFSLIALAALDNIIESIMGVSLESQRDPNSKYVKAVAVVSELVSTRMRHIILGNDTLFPLTSEKRIQDKNLEYLHNHANEVITKRRRELLESNTKQFDASFETGTKTNHAFLDLLLLAELDGKSLDDQSIKDEVETFMFEGHDTTSSGIAYGLHSIAKNPEVQRKVLEEQIEILGGDLQRDPTYSELQQLKYLESVIKETLRLYPSVPIMQRGITKDVEISGMRLLKDSNVIINLFHLHRHPDVFEDPLEFRPERYQTSLKNPFNWVPFSAGPRNCIGQKFAILQMKVMMGTIVRRFKILPGDTDPEPSGDLVLRSKNGIHVKLLPRN